MFNAFLPIEKGNWKALLNLYGRLMKKSVLGVEEDDLAILEYFLLS